MRETNQSVTGAATRRNGLRRALRALFVAYACFIVYATLLPFQFRLDAESLAAKQHWVNWDPTRLVTGDPTPLSDLVSNVIFFVPLGVLAWFLLRRRGERASIALCTLLGCGLSLSVETLQFLTPTRNPATSDLLSNTLGAFLGAAAAAAFGLRMRRSAVAQMRRWALREPLSLFLIALLLWLALRALVPLDVTFAVNEIVQSLRGARLLSWSDATRWVSDVEDVVSYALTAGVALAVGHRLLRLPLVLQVTGCVIGMGVLAAGLEATQLVVGSRVTDARDVVTAMAGATLGVVVALVLRRRPEPAATWEVVAGLYAFGVAVAALEPFNFRFDPASMASQIDVRSLLPYYTHYFKASTVAVNEFLDGLLMYMPLGFLLACPLARSESHAPLSIGARAALRCAGLALALELLQLALPTRYADASDVVTAALGGIFGAFIWVGFDQLQAAEAHVEQLQVASHDQLLDDIGTPETVH